MSTPSIRAVCLLLFLAICGGWENPAVGQAGSSKEQSTRQLEGLLSNRDSNARIRAIQSPEHKGESSIPVWIKALGDPDAFVRLATTGVLFDFGVQAIKRMLTAFDNGEAITKRSIAEGLMVGLAVKPNAVDSDLEKQIFDRTVLVRCNEQLCVSKWSVPTFPPLALQAQISGRVWTRVTIDRDGRVSGLSSQGHALLTQSVEGSVKDWVFRIRQGTAPITQILVVDFNVVGKKSDLGTLGVSLKLPEYVQVMRHPPDLNIGP